MSNKKRRARKVNARPAGAARNSAKITLGQGAQPYNEATIALLVGLVPGVLFVQPTGDPAEGDSDRLSRARAMAGYNGKPVGAVVRVESLCTKYFQEMVLGAAHEIHVMRSKVQHVGAATTCPFGTIIVVFKPGHRDRIENGLCQIYWETVVNQDEKLAEALESMTGGGVSTGVLCKYGDRKHPVDGYINIGGRLINIPVPYQAATDIRMVALAEPPIDSGVHQ